MTGATDAEEKTILDTRLDRVGVYQIGLFTTMPADDGTGGVEVSATNTNYARVSINVSATEFAAADATSAPTVKKGPTGVNVWAFPTPKTAGSGGVSWGDIVGMGVWEAAATPQLRWTAALATVVTVNAGDPAPQFDSSHQITFQAGDPTDPFT